MGNPNLVPYQGKEPYVFISYAHRDMDAVYSIISDLIGKGMRIWFDEGIDPGTEWDDNIAAHVQGCDSMIAFISASYLDSDNCRDELNYARDLKKDRLLVYLEPVELPAGMAMRMNRIQAVNRYNYDRPEDFQSKLMRCQFLVRSISGKESEENEDVPAPAAGQKPADGKSAEELVELGKNYLSGIGVEKNYNEAVRLFRLAADLNHPAAMFNLGRCCATGRGVPQDYREALQWHLKAAGQGLVNSQYIAGNMYLYGRPGVQKNPAEGFRWLRSAAMQGDGMSQTDLGLCYENGWGVPRDYSEAFHWYLKATEQGGISSGIPQYYLGRLYLNGHGVEKDYSKAVGWLQEAGGNPDAVNLLGYCYEKGYGVKQDPAEAAAMYRNAAAKGHVTAQFNLANCYLNGSGVEKDSSEAFEWYRKAAENTVSFDINGPLWSVDRKDAEQGQILAQKKLAECYRKGIGTEADEEEAQKWENAAAERELHPSFPAAP